MLAHPLERAARLPEVVVASAAAQQLQGLLDAVAVGRPMPATNRRDHRTTGRWLAPCVVVGTLHLEATLPPLLLATIPAQSRPRWWLRRRACARRSWAATRAILLVAGAGQDGGEAPRTFLDEECLFPVLVQHLQPLGRDPAGGLAGPGRDRVGRTGRGNSTGPEGGVGAMEEGWGPAAAVRLRPCSASAIPRVESPEHPPDRAPGPPHLLTERAGPSC
jgi:hypothetical protein